MLENFISWATTHADQVPRLVELNAEFLTSTGDREAAAFGALVEAAWPLFVDYPTGDLPELKKTNAAHRRYVRTACDTAGHGDELAELFRSVAPLQLVWQMVKG